MTDHSTPNASAAVPTGRYRWTICSLLFAATTINYIDRQILGILAPDLQRAIGWSEIEYGYIVMAFQAAYAIGLPLFGRFIDRYGTKLGYSLSILGWSIAAMGHALATSAFSFGVARVFLGFSEAGNFPSSIKTIAEWFPKKERALATGIFNSGANIGAVVAPATVPFLAEHYGWYGAFIATGALGFIWIVFWVFLYDRPEESKRLREAELAFIQSDREEVTPEKIPMRILLKHRETWAFVLGKFLTDPIWWFYLYWLPKFLHTQYGLTLTNLGLPLIAVYTMTTIGSVGGGWFSSHLIARGGEINRSRKIVMLVCALLVLPIVFMTGSSHLWNAVAFIGLAAAAHQGWSANLFTLVSDIFPKKAVGSVVGLGGMAGSVGGMLFAATAGYLLEWTGSYMTLFYIAASSYLIALAVIQLLVPKIKPLESF
jgi:ACS family hexuronate transporter-like MFS transporter